jgi:hypothetical protein
VQNKSVQHVEYRLEAKPTEAGSPAVEWEIASPSFELDSLGEVKIPVFVFVDRALYREPFPLAMIVTEVATGIHTDVELTFRGP